MYNIMKIRNYMYKSFKDMLLYFRSGLIFAFSFLFYSYIILNHENKLIYNC
ncbi:MAG: hypothetical protein K0R15_1055 [Clostridiales bacterium]|jgi:hypothetical protein|nr:hypothetical protein [Clostridiales bacterium]